MQIVTEYPHFFTATNLEWKKLLQQDKYKDQVIDCFRFLVENERVRLYAFIIMNNHLHLVWQMGAAFASENVQRDFLKYTAQKIKADLRKNDPAFLEQFRVEAKDRHLQLWERNSLSTELRSHTIFLQKLNYIHWNPVRAGLCLLPEEYKYSSAGFYEKGFDNWGFQIHYKD
jgi:REP element-mobilizing transposase RayT